MDPIWLMAIGAGLKGTITGVVRQALGGIAGGGLLGISDDILAIGLGWIGKEKLTGAGKDVMTGVMIAGIAGIVEGAIGGMPLLGVAAPAAQAAPQGQTLESAAAAL